MKHAMELLIVWMSINLVAGTLNGLGVYPGMGQVESMDPEQVYDAFDPNATIIGWTGEETGYEVGDPVRGIWGLWNTISLYVATVPAILSSWGVPSPIIWTLNAIWIAIWAIFGWEFISGRLLTN